MAIRIDDRTPLAPGRLVRPDIRAAILLEAAMLGDEPAATKFGVGVRSIQRWRRSVGVDEILSAEIESKKKIFEERWLSDLDITIGKAIRTVGSAVDSIALDPKTARNPELLHEVVQAVRILADVRLATKVIDARLEQMKRDQLPPAPSNPDEVDLGDGVYLSLAPGPEDLAAPGTPEAPEDIDFIESPTMATDPAIHN